MGWFSKDEKNKEEVTPLEGDFSKTSEENNKILSDLRALNSSLGSSAEQDQLMDEWLDRLRKEGGGV